MSKAYSKRDPLEKRFWARVSIPDDPDACWEWTGGKTSRGHGAITLQYKTISVHRLSYEMHVGAIPKNKFVCHHCDNPPCVNPAHLFIGSPLDNTQDMHKKGRNNGPPPPIFHGENHPMSKLTWEQVAEIRTLYESGHLSCRQIAERYDVTPSNIGCIVHYQTWRTEDSPKPVYPGSSKLTEDDIQAIRSEYAVGKVLQKELAKKYRVSQSHISQIISRKRREGIT